jgi:hypothetical protein
VPRFDHWVSVRVKFLMIGYLNVIVSMHDQGVRRFPALHLLTGNG